MFRGALALVAVISCGDGLPAPPPALPVGRPLPAMDLTDDAGAPFPLAALAGQPSWLVFFLGSSCPSCRAQLARLAALGPAPGVRLVAVAPDPPARLRALRAELGLPFALVSDQDEGAVGALCGGLGHCQLLVGADGLIRWGGFTDRWAEAPPPQQVLRAARRLIP
jgi:peroxiredoxin